jgi:hypothetical protein
MPSSSGISSGEMPTTEWAGRRDRERVPEFVCPLSRLAVVLERVMACRDVADNGELSWASSALCCAALVFCRCVVD